MERVTALVKQLFTEQALLQATLSDLRKKGPEKASKVQVKPVQLKGKLQYQFTFTVGPKVLHENVAADEAADKFERLVRDDFKQALIQSTDADYQILAKNLDKVTVLKKPATKAQAKIELSHNRTKQYLLPEGEPVPFLIELGVMNAQGKVLAAKYDKFKQINRFLEMIEDVTPYLSKERQLKIIDFGCGKSYLTFALYHYLVHTKELDIQIVGLDLKADVISICSTLAGKLNYAGLRFQVGDINQYGGNPSDEASHVDMVVTLHACDMATDAALEKAVRWGADVILSVPCCQHELFNQMKNDTLAPMLNHGIIKERFAALATDSIRAQLLDLLGYKTQILEFIDMEHTPKNLLIRAVKQEAAQQVGVQSETTRQNRIDEMALAKKVAAYLELKRFLQISPYLERVLADRFQPLFEKYQSQ